MLRRLLTDPLGLPGLFREGDDGATGSDSGTPDLLVGTPGGEEPKPAAPVEVLPAVYELGQVSAAVNTLKEENAELKALVSSLAGGLADLQEAVTDLRSQLQEVIAKEVETEERLEQEQRANWLDRILGGACDTPSQHR